MDDLYNGWENALSNALSEILDRITTDHLAEREFVIKKFNWQTMQFDGEETVSLTDHLIIEGVGAAQQIVRETGATTYWLDIEPEIGLQSVLSRDGAHIELQMRQWQVDQDKHFARDETRENCEFKLTS
jgi:predicted metal-dependent TIM-barrel fold hydrolase